jgi:hypothetical protein
MATFRINGTGSTYRRKTLGSGTFQCSNERCKSRRRGEATQAYRLREERKWISLLWIPIAPVGQRGRYVECGTCKAVHPPAYLERGATSAVASPAATETASQHATAWWQSPPA